TLILPLSFVLISTRDFRFWSFDTLSCPLSLLIVPFPPFRLRNVGSQIWLLILALGHSRRFVFRYVMTHRSCASSRLGSFVLLSHFSDGRNRGTLFGYSLRDCGVFCRAPFGTGRRVDYRCSLFPTWYSVRRR